jgi:hypothetical protein
MNKIQLHHSTTLLYKVILPNTTINTHLKCLVNNQAFFVFKQSVNIKP